MTLRDQVLAQAMLLAGELDSKQAELLGALCTASTASLAARLREGLTPQDCKADFLPRPVCLPWRPLAVWMTRSRPSSSVLGM